MPQSKTVTVSAKLEMHQFVQRLIYEIYTHFRIRQKTKWILIR